MQTNYTFWALINQYPVEIPIIQRDYAQGRENVKDIANKFLNSLYNSLYDNDNISLDFVYGRINEGKLIPLDGQQRLTTLFLLHWYLALKDGMYTEEVKEKLSTFTYETRLSSQDFCKNLTNLPISFSAEDEKLSDLIINSKWFFLSWKRDPTVKSMLNMLDLIHEKFKNLEDTYFDILVKDHLQIITFQFLPLDKFKLSDDLYLKMNSRGKPLTDYENFKTHFVKYLDHKSQSKLDNEWLDLFWNNQIDLDAYIDHVDLESTEAGIFNFITNMSMNLFVEENDINKAFIDQYNVFHTYEALYEKIENVHSITKTLDCLIDYKDDYNLFEAFLKPHNQISYWERARFYALSQFFLKIGAVTDENYEIYQRWIRICKNLINNQLIQSTEDYFRSIRAIKKLSDHIKNLYNVIGNDPKFIDFFTKIQREEESLKVSLIKSDPQWENEIIQAETHPYFNGQIGFILNFSKEDNGHHNLRAFRAYANKLAILFEEIRSGYDYILYRSMLVQGNYLPEIANSHTFCSFEEGLRAKNDNWRKVFNQEDSCVFLKSLLDKIEHFETTEAVVSDLKYITENHNITDWREYFIDYPEYIDFCENRKIRSYDWHTIFLARSKAPKWRKRAELYSYHFFKRYLENKILKPFNNIFYNESADYQPSVILDEWLFKNNNCSLHIIFGDEPTIEFIENNEEPLTKEIEDILILNGFNETRSDIDNTLVYVLSISKDSYAEVNTLVLSLCDAFNKLK